MKTPVPDYLNSLIEEIRPLDSGKTADYIPMLANADPRPFGVALTTIDGRTYSAGDDTVEFSIQSISKPFAYALALSDRGFRAVEHKVHVEPSGEAFNELSLEKGTHRPKNPMINAGAITIHQLLLGHSASKQDRIDHTADFFSQLAGRKLEMDESILSNEMDYADRNFAIAYMLRNYGLIHDDPREVVRGYTAQCSLKVTVRDLSVMGATLANGGIQPVTGKQVLRPEIASRTLSVMATSGMYDAAGSWLTEVGIPAKSGVSGGLLGALPGQVGIGVFSPRLDSYGNSVRGSLTCDQLSEHMGLHLMEVENHGSTTVRSITDDDERTVVTLQGIIQFVGAENLLHALDGRQFAAKNIIFDLGRVTRFSSVGRRMTLEAMRRLNNEGYALGVFDPDETLPEPDLGDGTFPDVISNKP